jgi:hypothetical protein
MLYRGDEWQQTIVDSTPNDGGYNVQLRSWTADQLDGNQYRIKIIELDPPNNFVFSPFFCIAKDPTTCVPRTLTFTSPTCRGTIAQGATPGLTWVVASKAGKPNAKNVKIDLYRQSMSWFSKLKAGVFGKGASSTKKGTLVKTVAASTPNDGSFLEFGVSAAEEVGNAYYVEIAEIGGDRSAQSENFCVKTAEDGAACDAVCAGEHVNMGMSAGMAVLTVVIVLGVFALLGGLGVFFYKRWKARRDAAGHQELDESKVPEATPKVELVVVERKEEAVIDEDAERLAAEAAAAATEAAEAKAQFKKEGFAASMLQAQIRGRSARRKIAYEKSHQLRPILVHVDYAEGLRAADENGLSDPFVVIHVVYYDEDGTPNFTFVSKSKTIKKTLEPRWGYEAFLPGVDTHMKVVMTVMDFDKEENDDFLGQCAVQVPPFEQIKHKGSEKETHANGASVQKKHHSVDYGVAFAEYEIGLGDLDKNLQPTHGMDSLHDVGQGAMHIRIDHFGGLAHTQCDWLKVASKKWDDKWMVLAGTELREYNSWGRKAGMSAKPTTLDLNAVEAVEVVPDDGEHENMFRLVIKQESKKFKGLYSYSCASAAKRNKWVQKIKMQAGLLTRT